MGHWAVAQVCDWSDYIGLGQYRKKFVHHCIDGRLLLKLSDKHLKVLARNMIALVSQHGSSYNPVVILHSHAGAPLCLPPDTPCSPFFTQCFFNMVWSSSNINTSSTHLILLLAILHAGRFKVCLAGQGRSRHAPLSS